MKKLIGIALWLLAFLIPFKYAILNTKEVVHADGSADNIVGLMSFVAMIALLFIGYALVDSSAPKPGSGHHAH